MHWFHDEHEGRRVRLAYCMNLHAAETLADVRAGIREVTLPLRDRLAGGTGPFGIGMYLASPVAAELDGDARKLDELGAFLAGEGLDPFTFNAFPYGGFHAASLKRAVFEPTWGERERLEFTSAVARVAARLAGGAGSDEHVSISTHAGRFGPWPDERAREVAVRNLVRFAGVAAELEERRGVRVVLSLEPEPRSSANDLAELDDHLARVRDLGPRIAAEAEDDLAAAERVRGLLDRHVGTCLDACHAAVEFEDGARALEGVPGQRALGPLGKLQFSSALSLASPGTNAGARERLLGMAEERYLHQVTGRLVEGPALLRATDLPEVAEACADPGSPWLACDEWRCHFHVPVDLEEVGAADVGSGAGVGSAAPSSGLATTRASADTLLTRALATPSSWGTQELHVEIETYTWDVLPGAARGPGDLIDGLEREYRHVTALLEQAGWHRA